MIFFCLKQHVFQLGVGGLQLSGLLLQLLESGEVIIKKFIESFAFILILGAFFLELFELNKIKGTLMAKFLFSSCCN